MSELEFSDSVFLVGVSPMPCCMLYPLCVQYKKLMSPSPSSSSPGLALSPPPTTNSSNSAEEEPDVVVSMEKLEAEAKDVSRTAPLVLLVLFLSYLCLPFRTYRCATSKSLRFVCLSSTNLFWNIMQQDMAD